MSLHTQLATMITMVLGGVYLGMALETFVRFKPYWQRNSLLAASAEVIFWVMQTVVLYVVLYQVNNGEIRVLIIVAVVLGFSMYEVLLKGIYRYVLEACIKVIHVMVIIPIGWMFRMIVWLIITLLKTIKYILLFLFTCIRVPLNLLLTIFKRLIPKKVYIKASQTYSFCSTMINNYINRQK